MSDYTDDDGVDSLSFLLPGVAIDGKDGVHSLVVSSAKDDDGEIVYGVWLFNNQTKESEQLAFVIDEECYEKLYNFFEPSSQGEITL